MGTRTDAYLGCKRCLPAAPASFSSLLLSEKHLFGKFPVLTLQHRWAGKVGPPHRCGTGPALLPGSLWGSLGPPDGPRRLLKGHFSVDRGEGLGLRGSVVGWRGEAAPECGWRLPWSLAQC